eukprot:TRINITY_DN12778_c0_g1_i2.p1 TRINITY_DN12778_c0_g1~~TRINITY_DN12778_c0_g1_i2.p1  ORF type:complete len:105 (+),score=4.83 TRINITY_DN12778_c0_g1_i2:71-385(+)
MKLNFDKKQLKNVGYHESTVCNLEQHLEFAFIVHFLCSGQNGVDIDGHPIHSISASHTFIWSSTGINSTLTQVYNPYKHYLHHHLYLPIYNTNTSTRLNSPKKG